MSKRSIPRTPKKVKRVTKSKPRKKSPAKRAKSATKKREDKPKKAKRARVSAPAKKPVKRAVKRVVKKAVKKTKRRSMNIHTPKKTKKVKKKAPRKTKREKDLELTVSALRKMVPAALIQQMVQESMPPKFAPLEERVSEEELQSVNRILEEDLQPELESDRIFIPIQPSIIDNMSPGVQQAIKRVEQYGMRLRNLDPDKLLFWKERNRIVRMILDVTEIWGADGNEREYMEHVAELTGRRTRAVYTDILSPGGLDQIFAEDAAE